MGFYPILSKYQLPKNHRSIALGVIVRGMGNWLPGHNRKNPEIHVSMISNISRVYGSVPRTSWRHWMQKFGIF